MSKERDALVQAKQAGTPSYSFKVGDSTILGAIESVHVEKVLYGEAVPRQTNSR